MKRQKSNENLRRRNADLIRRVMAVKLAEQKPTDRAKEWFRRPPYQAGNLIRAQGEQVEHKDTMDYLVEKYEIKTGVEAHEELGKDKDVSGFCR